MSAVGHKRTNRHGPKSTFVRFGPIADIRCCIGPTGSIDLTETALGKQANSHTCHGLHQAASGTETSWQPYFRYWHWLPGDFGAAGGRISFVDRQNHQRADG